MTLFHLVICPGFHNPDLTQELIANLSHRPLFQAASILNMPTQPHPWAVLSAHAIRQFIYTTLGLSPAQPVPSDRPLVFLAFSAGCVGATAAAHHWHLSGGRVAALFAVDGWGVPLAAPFPSYRLSHDHFTHQTSKLLGGQSVDFYADPPVPHLQLWRLPSGVTGWQVTHQSGRLCKADSPPPAGSQASRSESRATHWASLLATRPITASPPMPSTQSMARVAMTALDFLERQIAAALA